MRDIEAIERAAGRRHVKIIGYSIEDNWISMQCPICREEWQTDFDNPIYDCPKGCNKGINPYG